MDHLPLGRKECLGTLVVKLFSLPLEGIVNQYTLVMFGGRCGFMTYSASFGVEAKDLELSFLLLLGMAERSASLTVGNIFFHLRL